MPQALKEKLRQFYLDKRDNIATVTRRRKSCLIKEKLAASAAYKAAFNIGFYCSIGSEVETREMMKNALAAGKRIFLPTINPQKKTMFFSEHDGDLGGLVCNFYGILEPQGPFQDHKIFDVIIVPGLAFDYQGWRLGYGAGYYDRFLKQVKAVIIGVAYSEQICESLPHGDNDVPMDMLITDNGIYTFDQPPAAAEFSD